MSVTEEKIKRWMARRETALVPETREIVPDAPRSAY